MAGNGQGSVFPASPVKGPDGKLRPRKLPWCASVTDGWTLAGRPVRRSRFAATKAEAADMLADMLDDRRAGRPVADDRLTLRAYLGPWLAGRSDLRAGTVRTWRAAADRLLRRLGSRRLRHLTPTEVEAALGEMPGPSARIARTLLVVALADAERDGRVSRNVARLARSPRVTPGAVTVPDAAAARALIAVAASHRLGALIVAALGTSLREGELLGLTRDCLDLDAGIARIDWQLQWVEGEPRLVMPKPDKRRNLPLAPFVITALRSHRARQDTERLAAGARWRDADGLVFTTALGRPVHPNTARYVLDVLCTRAGLPHLRFHALRHAALTVITERAGQKAAQAMAGHSSITTTDIYAHPTDDLARRAAAALQEAIG